MKTIQSACVVLPGLVGVEWSVKQMLGFVALVMWERETLLRKAAEKLSEPFDKADFGCALRMAGWAKTHGHRNGVRLPETGLAAWTDEARREPAILLADICEALYRVREVIFATIEGEVEDPAVAAELAELMVVAEEVCHELGYGTEINGIENLGKPTKAQKLAWSLRAKELGKYFADEHGEWNQLRVQYRGDDVPCEPQGSAA